MSTPPPTPFGIIARATVGATGNAVSFAFGLAVSPLLAPVLEEVRQSAWARHPSKLPDVGTLIEGVVEGHVDEGQAREWASREGFGDEAFDAMLRTEREGPPVGAAVNAVRRRALSPEQLHEVYRRHAIEEEWWPALDRLVPDLLDPSQLAAAIHRGLIPDPGLLKGEQPSGPRKVEAYPVYPIDALAEAEGSGYDAARLGVLVGLQGLPMGTHEAALALFRNIITHGDYIAAFNQSNSRNEWAEAVLEQARQIPTARDFLENALRGYTTLQQAIAGASLHGMTAEHATLIYQNQGRPMNVRQIQQALSRGGVFKPEPGEITDPFDAAIVEGNLKPAYYDLQKTMRYTPPSVFAIRQLATSGVWDQAKTAKRLRDWGWVPEEADEVATAWTGQAAGESAGSGKWADRARSRLWTVTHNEYLDDSIDQAKANEALDVVGVPQSERQAIFAAWDMENQIGRTELTTAQVKRGYKTGRLTQDDAVARLADKGITIDDARVILELDPPNPPPVVT